MKPREAKAIAAILRHTDQIAAAEELGITTRHLRRILRREHVAAELNRRARELINGTARTLAAGSSKAADVLISMAEGETPAAGPRVSACRAVVELALRAGEIGDLEERLLELERAGGAPRPAWRTAE